MNVTIALWRRWIVGTALVALVLAGTVGCTPTAPATKTPDSKPGQGDREQLPTPPKREPG